MPVSEALLVGCGEPSQVQGDTMGQLLQNHVDVAQWGWRCAQKHKALSDAVRQFNDAATGQQPQGKKGEGTSGRGAADG